MYWQNTTEAIEDERDLTLIERMLDGQTPVNVRLRQVPRLIAALRRAWRSNAELRKELAALRRSGGRRTRHAA